jgi:hypothetical protein
MIQVPNWSLWSVLLIVYVIKQIFHFWHIISIILEQVTFSVIFVWAVKAPWVLKKLEGHFIRPFS